MNCEPQGAEPARRSAGSPIPELFLPLLQLLTDEILALPRNLTLLFSHSCKNSRGEGVWNVRALLSVTCKKPGAAGEQRFLDCTQKTKPDPTLQDVGSGQVYGCCWCLASHVHRGALAVDQQEGLVLR